MLSEILFWADTLVLPPFAGRTPEFSFRGCGSRSSHNRNQGLQDSRDYRARYHGFACTSRRFTSPPHSGTSGSEDPSFAAILARVGQERLRSHFNSRARSTSFQLLHWPNERRGLVGRTCPPPLSPGTRETAASIYLLIFSRRAPFGSY